MRLLALPILAYLAVSTYAQGDGILDFLEPCVFEGEVVSDPYNCTKYYTCEKNAQGEGFEHVQLKIVAGNPETDLRTYNDNNTDSGRVHHRQFCASCGSQLFITNDDNEAIADLVFVTRGTLDIEAGEWAPEQEYFCKRREPWLPGLNGTDTFMVPVHPLHINESK
ncbi:hypothetical protein BDV18DRAFT_155424 [Aspergillus unguis]